MKTCKICKSKFSPFQTTQQVCGIKCAIKHAESKKQKKLDKEHRVRKREYYLNDLSTRKKAVKKACHAYIRARDRGLPCICCGEPTRADSQAGHYLPSGSNYKIKYNENNIHLQNLNCNYFKGGDSGKYRENLIYKIGLEQVQKLESLKGGVDNRTASHLLHIEQYYKRKLKQLTLNNTIA